MCPLPKLRLAEESTRFLPWSIHKYQNNLLKHKGVLNPSPQPLTAEPELTNKWSNRRIQAKHISTGYYKRFLILTYFCVRLGLVCRPCTFSCMVTSVAYISLSWSFLNNFPFSFSICHKESLYLSSKLPVSPHNKLLKKERKEGRTEGRKGKKKNFTVASEKKRVTAPRQVQVCTEYAAKDAFLPSYRSSKGLTAFRNIWGKMGRSLTLLSATH